jgi:Fur family ferric uptake transcriptional regulator
MPATGRDQVRLRIRQAGLRATPARIATYEVLLDAKAPLTHGDVTERLAGAGFDRATVYRNLVDLSEAGLVFRSDHGDHAWRFELRARGHHESEHIHFVCVDCGDVSCLPHVGVTIRSAKGAPRAVSSQKVQVQLRGRCDSCD